MSKLLKIEYEDGMFVEIVSNEDSFVYEEGLGGERVERILEVSKKTFDRSLDKMISFTKFIGKKVQMGFADENIDEISVSLGVSLGLEGNFIFTNATTEAAISISATYKKDDRHD